MWMVRAEPGMDGVRRQEIRHLYMIQGIERKAAIIHHSLVSSLHLARPGHDSRRLSYAAAMPDMHFCSLHRSINP